MIKPDIESSPQQQDYALKFDKHDIEFVRDNLCSNCPLAVENVERAARIGDSVLICATLARNTEAVIDRNRIRPNGEFQSLRLEAGDLDRVKRQASCLNQP